MSQANEARIIFERLQREQAEIETRRILASRELSRPSTRQALKGDRIDLDRK